MNGSEYYISFVISIAVIAYLSLFRQKKAKSGDDFFLSGRNLNHFGVSRVIIATIVGGASTVGTVQMGFKYGISSIIYTFSAGIGCFILGKYFAKPLREKGVTTVSQFIGKTYGEQAQAYSSFFSSIGMFIQVVAQFLAAMAVIETAFPFSRIFSFIATLLLTASFVMIGGIKGSDYIGKLKFYLMYIIMASAAIIALGNSNALILAIPKLPSDLNFFSFSNYGFGKASFDIIATIIGVVSTQTYLQSIFAAKDAQNAKKGLYISSALIPSVGALGALVGIYLRAYHPELAGNSAQALPFFINHYFPHIVAAIFMSGLLVISIGTAAGLTLGVATNLYVDFLKNYNFLSGFRSELNKARLMALIALLCTSIVIFAIPNATILNFTFLSMGLRGASILLPLLAIVFFNKYGKSKTVKWLIYAMPIAYIIITFLL